MQWENLLAQDEFNTYNRGLFIMAIDATRLHVGDLTSVSEVARRAAISSP
jgi:hypothetical protein